MSKIRDNLPRPICSYQCQALPPHALKEPKMKSKIKRLLSDPGAMLGGAIIFAIVVFAGAVGFWIKGNLG
jgi:hypothetical protein